MHFLILAENAVVSVSYFEVQEMLWMKCNDAQIYHHHHYRRRRNNKKKVKYARDLLFVSFGLPIKSLFFISN